MYKGCDKLWLCKAGTSALKHTLLALVFRVVVIPRIPTAREPLLNEATHPELLQVCNTLLAFLIELLLRELLRLGAFACKLSNDILSGPQLLLQRCDLLLKSSLLGRLYCQTLRSCHLRVGGFLRYPIALPVHKGSHELWLRKAARGSLQHPLLVHVILIDVEPRCPSASKTLLHEATNSKLLEVSNAFLTLALELFLHQPLLLCIFSAPFQHRLACIPELLADLDELGLNNVALVHFMS